MNTLDKIKIIVEYAASNKLTTICAVVWTIVSMITANPTSVAFLGPASQALVLQVSLFLKDAAVAFGFIFAAEKLPKLTDSEKKPVKKAKKIIKKPTEE
jgi:hypothetical protein